MRPEEEINSAFLAAYADELQGAASASTTGGGTGTTTADGTTGTSANTNAGGAAARRAPFLALRRELYQHARTLQVHNALFAVMLVITLIILFRARR